MTQQFAETAADQQQGQHGQQPARTRRTLRGITVALAGGALTAGALALVAYNASSSFNASTGAASSLSTVAMTDIGAAVETLAPSASSQLAAGARNCNAPLAHVTIAKLPGASGGTIRIRSGNYLSPPFQLTDTPQRIAIPFPAPYPLGRGVISIEGSASGAMISLHPAWTIAAVNGGAVHNVVWQTGNPCK